MNPWFRQLIPVLLLFSAGFSLWLPGCKPREEELQTSGALEFSADTVKFDTVFTTLRTVTKRLWVYNHNDKAVNVDLVGLENAATSPYTLLIGGDLKQTATNLFIRGQDSLLILVRAKLTDSGQNGAAKNLVVQENLNFRTNGQDQHVLLRSFGQNIYFHQNAALGCDEVWTNDRPHVLYGVTLVRPGCTLRLKPGTRVFAHAGATLIVQGTLLVNSPADFTPGTGATDTIKATNANIVRFTGDRSEAQYATAPGQWTGIVLDSCSHGNIIRYAQIQNSTFGVLLYNVHNQQPQPDVRIENSVIRYISGSDVSFAGAASSLGLPGAGVLNVAGSVRLENTLLSDCYETALLSYGGSCSVNYCTIANYPATAGVRGTASLYFTNELSVDAKTVKYPLAVDVRNSIVWGAIEDELFFVNYADYQSGITVQNSVLRTKLYAALTDAADKPGLAKAGLNNLISSDYYYPKFLKINTLASNDYRLGAGSPASASKNSLPPSVARDLLNLPRNLSAPDLGAYQTTK